MGKRLGKTADLFSGQGLSLMVLCAVFLLGGAAGCLFSGAAGQATVAELTRGPPPGAAFGAPHGAMSACGWPWPSWV